MKFDKRNQRLTNFNGIRDYVVANAVKFQLPKQQSKKEVNANLFAFG